MLCIKFNMAICCAVGCSNRSDRERVSFHRFPKDTQLKKAWTVALRRKGWTPSPTSVICSKHFEEKYCTRLLSKTLLTEDAIPTLFPTHKAICKIKKIACPANVPVNISVAEPTDKTTDREESIYAIGFKMTENILNSAEEFHSADFPTEHAEDFSTENAEDFSTENAEDFSTENAEDFPIEHAKNSVRDSEETGNVQIQSSSQKLPTIVYTLTSTESEDSIALLKDKLNTVKAENWKYKRELRALQQKSRRLNNNIANMEKFIYSYKVNNWISDASLEILKTIPSLDNELLALHLCFNQSYLPEECLTDANTCGESSDIKNSEDASPISISDW